jgi:hypothetical protein
MAADEYHGTLARKEKHTKQPKAEQKEAHMDVTFEIKNEADGKAQKKRKADVLGVEEALSKKEKKKLRKLAKGKAENAAIRDPLQDGDEVPRKRRKKDKKQKPEQEVCRFSQAQLL